MYLITSKKRVLKTSLIILFFLLFSIFFFLNKENINDVSAQCYSCCAGSCGSGGCRFNTGGCYASEVSWNCGGSNMCCVPGPCGDCTPSCPTYYQSSNNGCSSTSASCTKHTCIGTSCGTNSMTCYLVKYAVNYTANGGTCAANTTVCRGSANTAPNCTRTCYTRGNYTQSGCGGTFTASTGVCSSITATTTITANWTLQTNSVTVNPNSGSCTQGTHTVNCGSTSLAPNCTRTGYTRSGYSLTGTCSGTWTASTGVCSNVQNAITVTPSWTINSYQVTVVPDSGTCSPGTHSVDYGSASSNPGCTRTGYILTGYSLTSGTCGGTFTASTGICSSITQAITVTAQWVVDNQPPNAPTTPYCNGATNPTNVTTANPTFSAVFSDPDATDVGDYYEIEVNTASDFTGTVKWDSGILGMTSTNNGFRSPDITYAGSSLGWSGTTYYWRIRFGDQDSAMSDWSSTQNFTMHSNTVPSAPTSLQTEQATDPIQVTDLTPDFRAIFNDVDSGDTGVQFEIEVNTNNTFTGTVMWDSGIQGMTATAIGNYSPEIAYAGSALSLNGVTYYWRIRFVDNYSGVSTWSSTAQFTMNNIPTATDLKINGLTNPNKIYVTSSPYFTAYFSDIDTPATGTHYEIEVNTASNFGGTVMWDSGQAVHTPPITNNSTSSQITYSGTALTANGQVYYWRIRFWDNAGTPSAWSSTANFRTTVAPSAPTALLVDGQTNPPFLNSLNPTFSAIHNDLNGDSASSYEIEVNSSNLFSGTVMWDTGKLSSSVTNASRSPNYTYAGTALTGSSSTVYYWRIRFWDSDDNMGEWSTVNSFNDSLKHIYLEGLGLSGIRLD